MLEEELEVLVHTILRDMDLPKIRLGQIWVCVHNPLLLVGVSREHLLDNSNDLGVEERLSCECINEGGNVNIARREERRQLKWLTAIDLLHSYVLFIPIADLLREYLADLIIIIEQVDIRVVHKFRHDLNRRVQGSNRLINENRLRV